MAAWREFARIQTFLDTRYLTGATGPLQEPTPLIPPPRTPPSGPPSTPSQTGPSQPRAADPSSSLPEWMTFEPNIERWADVLSSMGVDMPAQQTLFLLGQLPGGGYAEANRIVASLLHKQASRAPLSNISGFVTTSARNARREIEARLDEHRESRRRTQY